MCRVGVDEWKSQGRSYRVGVAELRVAAWELQRGRHLMGVSDFQTKFHQNQGKNWQR